MFMMHQRLRNVTSYSLFLLYHPRSDLYSCFILTANPNANIPGRQPQTNSSELCPTNFILNWAIITCHCFLISSQNLNVKAQKHVHYPLITLPHPRSPLQLNKAGSKRACSDVYMRTTGVHLAQREESRVLRALEREERARRCRLRALCVGFCTTSCSHNPPSFTKSMVLKCVKTRHCNRLLSRVVANFHFKALTGYKFSPFLYNQQGPSNSWHL